jgi:ubiquinone/menaquinone biosynthesis C-methylase UbiE
MKDLVMMTKSPSTYIPAAGHEWFLPLYDVMTKLAGADKARRALPDQAELRPLQRVLDVGCGTGTLITLLKHLYPEIDVVGLDPDPKALGRARRKAERAGVSVQLKQGFYDALEYPADSFDHVFSSFMFHHLENGQKEEMLREIRRVLKPGGYLHLLDFGGPESAVDRSSSRWLHSHSRLKDNSASRILTLMTEAGFVDVKNVGQRVVLFGLARVAYYQASVPSSTANTSQS